MATFYGSQDNDKDEDGKQHSSLCSSI